MSCMTDFVKNVPLFMDSANNDFLINNILIFETCFIYKIQVGPIKVKH